MPEAEPPGSSPPAPVALSLTAKREAAVSGGSMVETDPVKGVVEVGVVDCFKIVGVDLTLGR